MHVCLFERLNRVNLLLPWTVTGAYHPIARYATHLLHVLLRLATRLVNCLALSLVELEGTHLLRLSLHAFVLDEDMGTLYLSVLLSLGR